MLVWGRWFAAAAAAVGTSTVAAVHAFITYRDHGCMSDAKLSPKFKSKSPGARVLYAGRGWGGGATPATLPQRPPNDFKGFE